MELNRSPIIERMQSKMISIDDFNFDKLTAPSLYSIMSQYDIDRLYNIATSVRYSGNTAKKYKAIDEIMKPRGFLKLSAGTNRVVYRFLEDSRFVTKVAYDAVGIKDNPSEFKNQFIFKPFVTKIFEVDPSGVIGSVERVHPITSREEFMSVASDVYDLINGWLIGEYILADIGTKFFMNIGIRKSFGPVLLDFPYVYKLDGNKLYCTANKPELGGICGGEIDYDDGFNFLRCTKCGTRYKVRQLAKDIENEIILVKGKKKMKVEITRGNGITQTVGDNDGFKEATAKVESSKINTGMRVATGYVKTVDKNNKKNNNHSNNDKRNNAYRNANNQKRNNGFNRGIVRATEEPKFSVEVGNGSNLVDNDNDSVSAIDKSILSNVRFSEYDAEADIMIFTAGEGDEQVKIPADLTTIPEDVMENFVALSGIGRELEEAKSDLIAQENKYAEKAKEVTKLNTVIDEYNHEIDDLNSRYELLISENKEKDDKIKELEAKIEELNKEKDAVIKDKESTVTYLEGIVTSLESENNQLKIAINMPELESTDSYVVNYNTEGSVFIGAVVVKMSELLNVPEEQDHYVLAFIDSEDSYMGDADNNFVMAATINGRSIDSIIESAKSNMENENKVVEESTDKIESKEAPVGAVQK